MNDVSKTTNAAKKTTDKKIQNNLIRFPIFCFFCIFIVAQKRFFSTFFAGFYIFFTKTSIFLDFFFQLRYNKSVNKNDVLKGD